MLNLLYLKVFNKAKIINLNNTHNIVLALEQIDISKFLRYYNHNKNNLKFRGGQFPSPESLDFSTVLIFLIILAIIFLVALASSSSEE